MPSHRAVHSTDAFTYGLAPLAWILDDLRRSLGTAQNAVRRFVLNAKNGTPQSSAELDTGDLHTARRQLYQGAAALDIVNQPALAKILRALESVYKKFGDWPDACSEDAVQSVERASRALLHFLEALLKGSDASTVALFPQLRALLEIAGSERVHPADLWSLGWDWSEVPLSSQLEPLIYARTQREQLGSCLLYVLQTLDRPSAVNLVDLCVGLARGEKSVAGRSFWAVAAGFLEAIASGCLPDDVYVRRSASRLIPQYAQLAEPSGVPSKGVTQELLFFCAIARIPPAGGVTVLRAVRSAFLLTQHPATDYAASPFGRFDPVHLLQARRRIDAAVETWSALAGGELTRLQSIAEQFESVIESITKLHLDHAALLSALRAAGDITIRSSAAPKPPIALEVATSLLYLEAAYDGLDLTSEMMELRGNLLAVRLQHVCGGGDPQPIEIWMEQLYRRVSDRQTMGTITLELRSALREVEKSLDKYCRNPEDFLSLQSVPVHLWQMRGVFTVLGLDQAAVAVLRIRTSVEQLLMPNSVLGDTPPSLPTNLINSLSTLGFLIDMLTYQPMMAKELFVYDEVQGELKLSAERDSPHALIASVNRDRGQKKEPDEVAIPAGGDTPTIESTSGNADPANWGQFPNEPGFVVCPIDEEDLEGIFLIEAKEVVSNGLTMVAVLIGTPDNVMASVALRRAFHTLKGSARMVGNSSFGDAAWAFEELLNSRLNAQQPVDEPVLQLCEGALQAMASWVGALTSGESALWQAGDFRRSADSLRLESRFVPIPVANHADRPEVSIAQKPLIIEVKTGGLALVSTSADHDLLWKTIEPDTIANTTTAPKSSVYWPSFPSSPDEHMAVPAVRVGCLELSATLFEVFVAEASTWSRRLQSEIFNWEPQKGESVPLNAASLAHSLQGSSATVGFTALTALARSMEQALEHVNLLDRCGEKEKLVVAALATDIVRLLEAFADRKLMQADPSIAKALSDLLNPVRRLVEPPIEGNCDTDGQSEPAAWTDTEIKPQSTVEFTVVTAPKSKEPSDHLLLDQRQAAVALDELLALAPAPLGIRGPAEHDLESVDLLDAELMPIFIEEARELVPALAAALKRWFTQPEEDNSRSEALRSLHTLKGSARLAGALRMGEQAHRLESSIALLGTGALHPTQVEPCLRQVDQLAVMFATLAEIDSKAIFAVAWQGGAPAAVGTLPGSMSSHAPLVATAFGASSRTLASQSVRVRAQILDRLIDQVGEVMISRSRVEVRVTHLQTALGEFGHSLERLRQQLRDLELQAELQMQSRLGRTQDVVRSFDPLELDRFTRVQEVSRMLAETVGDIEVIQKSLNGSASGAHDELFTQGRRAKELQQDLLGMRLIEFEGIADRLYGVVRQASKDAAKTVRLDILGGSIEIDRGMLDRMTPAFEHLLRNAVAHGIEPANVRSALGKPITGAITIAVQQDGSDVSITVSDDGAGLQLEKIRARALAADLIAPGQSLTQEEAARMLFIPGFTTADQVTELAGRGIGMDVVFSDVSAVGGRVETESQAGVGTKFKVVFPLTTAVTQVVMLRCGAVSLGVPANLLETVLRVPTAALQASYAGATFQDAVQSFIPFFWAGALLDVSDSSQEVSHRQHAVAVVRSAGQRVALHVDEVLGSREVVVKNLGPQLAGLPGLVGMSVLASGSVAMIYNPVALANLFGDAARIGQKMADPRDRNATSAYADAIHQVRVDRFDKVQAPLVLVVDDSITVRRVTQRLLHREGFRVALATDGLQALEVLQDERPIVVLSDLEMPRMDGLDLARNIRCNPDLSDLPIIVITSRIAQKHRDHAASLGVNHYLGKPYVEADLIKLVRSYCPVPEAA